MITTALMVGLTEKSGSGLDRHIGSTSWILHPALVVGHARLLKSLSPGKDSSAVLARSRAELVVEMSWSWLHHIVRYVAHSLAVIEH